MTKEQTVHFLARV